MFKELLIILAVVAAIQCEDNNEWNEGPGYPKPRPSYYPQNEPQLRPPVNPAYNSPSNGKPPYDNYPSGPQYSDRQSLSPQRPMMHNEPHSRPYPRHHTAGYLKYNVLKGFNSLKNGAMKPAVGTALHLAAPVFQKTAKRAAPLYDKVVDWSKTRDGYPHQHHPIRTDPIRAAPLSHYNYPPHSRPVDDMPQSPVRDARPQAPVKPPKYAPSNHY